MSESEVSTKLDLTTLEARAKQCRRLIVEMVHKAGASHPGGSLSAIDLIVGLYGTQMRIRIDEPD